MNQFKIENYQTLIDSTSELIWVVDPVHHALVLFNKALRDFFKRNLNIDIKIGMTPEELVGKEVQHFWHKAYQEATDKGEAYHYYQTIDESFILKLNFASLKADNEMIGVSVFAENIAEEIYSKRKLEEANQKLIDRFEKSINALSKIVEIRDTSTAGHQKRVKQLSVALAKYLTLDPKSIEYIGHAAAIHDIGKIYIAADILNKPGIYTELEFMLVQTHVLHSRDIAVDMGLPYEVVEIIHHHHERMDGSGYPQGLEVEEINLGAKILAVADVMEAMMAHRTYRSAHSMAVALSEIEAHKGSKYDANVVEACIDLFKNKHFTFVE